MSSPLLQVCDVSKQFGSVRALEGVSLDLNAGEVLGLVGENGAGKSTLINVLGGVVRPDQGRLRLDGQPYAPSGPLAAARAGIALVHQELNLLPNLTIAENLFLTNFPRRRLGPLRWIDRRQLRRQARNGLKQVELDLDPDTLVEALSPGERQLVEIAKALLTRSRLLVFDEPTTSLTRRECERLFDIIRRLRQQGLGILFVSHNLGDVLRLCDRVLVLRDGQVQGLLPGDACTIAELITLMIGRRMDQLYPSRTVPPRAEPVLQVEGVTQPGVVEDIRFTLHRGEVLGLAGLMGAGRTELARILFGLDPCTAGSVRLAGRSLDGLSPAGRIRHGLAFLTEDRRGEGLLLEATVEDNLALVALPRFSRATGWIERRRLRTAAAELVDRLQIACPGLTRGTVQTLSGGNQQKVVFGKWLPEAPAVYLLDEPTRGVDVAAKFEIYGIINQLAEAGAGILLISSEIEELLGMCDRILVLTRGRLTGEFQRDHFDRAAILRCALGEERLQ